MGVAWKKACSYCKRGSWFHSADQELCSSCLSKGRTMEDVRIRRQEGSKLVDFIFSVAFVTIHFLVKSEIFVSK